MPFAHSLSRLSNGLDQFRMTEKAKMVETLAREGQRPEAIVLTCADSRVAPETIFQAEVGQLFTVRVAGNVVGAHEVASIEFAALALNVPICIVAGHTRCGAVSASADWHIDRVMAATPSLQQLIQEIEPAIHCHRDLPSKEAVIEAATLENVRRSITRLTQLSPALAEKHRQGEFLIRGCVFDLDGTTLNWLD